MQTRAARHGTTRCLSSYCAGMRGTRLDLGLFTLQTRRRGTQNRDAVSVALTARPPPGEQWHAGIQLTMMMICIFDDDG